MTIATCCGRWVLVTAAGDVEGICPRSRRAVWTQFFSVPRAIPRSSEIEAYEDPSVVS